MIHSMQVPNMAKKKSPNINEISRVNWSTAEYLPAITNFEIQSIFASQFIHTPTHKSYRKIVKISRDIEHYFLKDSRHFFKAKLLHLDVILYILRPRSWRFTFKAWQCDRAISRRHNFSYKASKQVIKTAMYCSKCDLEYKLYMCAS